MIITNLSTWKYDDSLEGLLFFAQRILELSYDKSDYYEKDITSSITEIISECLHYIELEEQGGYEVSSKELDSLFEELKEKIQDDSVFKKILGDKREYYLNLLDKDTDRKRLKNTLEILELKFDLPEYFDNLKEQVKKFIIDYKRKDDLLKSTTMFFNFLTSYGYQKGTIYYLVNKLFFDKSGINKVESLESLDIFFNWFDLEYKQFEVVFSASKMYADISDSCKKVGLKVVENKEPVYGQSFERKFYRHRNNKVFIICENISALDYRHAMKLAKENIALISDLFLVFYHSKKPWFSDNCLVYKHNKEHVVLLKKSSNTMTTLSENDFDYVQKIFPVFLTRFGLKADSFNRFHRGVELHAHALETDEIASQILNLWICLEALLITEKSKSHIAIVAESIEVIDSIYVIRRKISNLRNLLLLWDKEKFEEARMKLPESLRERQIYAVAALVGAEEFKNIAGELLSEMHGQPLLRYKFMKLVRELQTRKSVTSIMLLEKIKCQRDIRRIYRSRNKIVHQGNMSDHGDYIAEMAHYYLDIVLFAIIERKIAFGDIRSIENFMHEIQITSECYKSYLGGTDRLRKKLTSDDVVSVLLGPQN